MSEQWEIGSEVNAEDYTQCAIYCNQLGDRHIERQNDAYLVVANPITSQITIATGNNAVSYTHLTLPTNREV